MQKIKLYKILAPTMKFKNNLCGECRFLVLMKSEISFGEYRAFCCLFCDNINYKLLEETKKSLKRCDLCIDIFGKEE